MVKQIKTDTPTTMEELLASLSSTPLQVSRGQEIEGEIVSISDREITLDLGAKSEGVISAKDLTPLQKENFKIGDKIKAYVIVPEGDSGQIILSFNKAAPTKTGGPRKNSLVWDRFASLKDQNSLITGKVMELNKGGVIIEVDGIRGFLPSSLIGKSALTALNEGEVKAKISEVDQGSNRLILTQKGLEDEPNLSQFKAGQKIEVEIVAILPFGLVAKGGEVYGIIFGGEVSWERKDDLNKDFKVGQKLETVVLEVESDLGRLNLSLRALTKDPFEEKSAQYSGDDTVKGVVSQVIPNGLVITLEDGLEGFMPSSKIEPGTKYEAGQNITATVDSVDKNRRRINLAPFITSTAGLIYK